MRVRSEREIVEQATARRALIIRVCLGYRINPDHCLHCNGDPSPSNVCLKAMLEVKVQ